MLNSSRRSHWTAKSLARARGPCHDGDFMRYFLVLLVILGSSQPLLAADRPPNVIIIYADDLGYGDIHALNPVRGKIATPNVDRFITEGMTFTDAHSGSSVCT